MNIRYLLSLLIAFTMVPLAAMQSFPCKGVQINVIYGSIEKLECVDAIVNAANTSLMGGSGIDGAIHAAAGPQLKAYCSKLQGCAVGNAVTTPSFNLQNQGIHYIIHTVSPHGTDKNWEQLLANAYNSVLNEAQRNNIASLAICTLGIGVYACNPKQASIIAVRTIKEWLNNHQAMHTLTEIHFVIYDKDQRSKEIFNYYTNELADNPTHVTPAPAPRRDLGPQPTPRHAASAAASVRPHISTQPKTHPHTAAATKTMATHAVKRTIKAHRPTSCAAASTKTALQPLPSQILVRKTTQKKTSAPPATYCTSEDTDDYMLALAIEVSKKEAEQKKNSTQPAPAAQQQPTTKVVPEATHHIASAKVQAAPEQHDQRAIAEEIKTIIENILDDVAIDIQIKLIDPQEEEAYVLEQRSGTVHGTFWSLTMDVKIVHDKATNKWCAVLRGVDQTTFARIRIFTNN